MSKDPKKMLQEVAKDGYLQILSMNETIQETTSKQYYKGLRLTQHIEGSIEEHRD